TSRYQNGRAAKLMTKIAITGAGGFLGLHLRAAAMESGIETVSIPLGERFDVAQAQAAISGADKLIHLAGVNRGTDEEVANGNTLFASQLATVLEGIQQAPAKVIYANSIQAGNGSVYGSAKQQAAATLGTAAERSGSTFKNIMLPNLFGEYGRPFYNSVVATFSHLIANGEHPEVHQE